MKFSLLVFDRAANNFEKSIKASLAKIFTSLYLYEVLFDFFCFFWYSKRCYCICFQVIYENYNLRLGGLKASATT